MDATELVVVASLVIGLVGFLTLCGGLIAVVIMLAYTNKKMALLGERAFDGAMSFHESHREMKRIAFEADHQEFLLREARQRDREASGEIPRPPVEEPDLMATPPSTLG